MIPWMSVAESVCGDTVKCGSGGGCYIFLPCPASRCSERCGKPDFGKLFFIFGSPREGGFVEYFSCPQQLVVSTNCGVYFFCIR